MNRVREHTVREACGQISRGRTLTLLFAFALTVTAWSGCETAVDPVIETDLPFTMYGYFNPTSDTQAVRIFPIDGVLERTADQPLGAVVTSANLTTGDERVWSDSIITFPPRGEIGHVFWSNFRVAYEDRVQLTVERPDGAQSVVTVDVPPEVISEILPGDETLFELPIEVRWYNAPNLIDIVVTYKTSVGSFSINYGVTQREISDGRAVLINFREDTRDILLLALAQGIRQVALTSLELSLIVTNREWVPPDGNFDPNFLVEPGTFSNVANGFGFVGAGYRQSIEWTPAKSFLEAAGFTVE